MLKAHSGDPREEDRVSGNRRVKLRNPALTVFVMGQSSILSALINDDEFAVRGLHARFLYSAPESMVGRQNPTPTPLPDNIEMAYFELVTELLDIPDPSSPNVLKLDPDAYALLTQFRTSLIKRRLLTELAFMKDWGSKYAGTILRIAGNLHLMEYGSHAGHKPISEDTMRNAIAVGEYFLAYAKWAYSKAGANADLVRATGVLDRLQADRPTRISMRDLHRLCPGRNKVTAKDFEPTIELLGAHGYLRAVVTAQKANGRPSILYEINPYLYTNTIRSEAPAPDDDGEIAL
jgi:hypothetical protein